MALIKRRVDESAKGVSVESLRKSRKIRADFISKFGSVPTSILVHDRSDKAIDLIRDGRSYKGMNIEETGGEVVKANPVSTVRNKPRNYNSGDFKTGDAKLDKTGFGARGHTVRKDSGVRQDPNALPPLSSFFQNICRLMIEMYCPEGGTVVDLFSGHNSRLESCYRTGRNYIGFDVSKEFMRMNEKVKELLYKQNSKGLIKNKATIQLTTCSSNHTGLPDCVGDFSITSPPYYNLEEYTDEPEQLGKAPTYEDFLVRIKEHVAENFRVLKPGAFCAWFINDFRFNKKFYPYHIDLYRIFVEVGFEPFNIYIVDLGNPVTAAFVQEIIETKILPKRHEYCLLFRKPNGKR